MDSSIISYRIIELEEPISFPDGRTYEKSAIVEKWVNRTKLSSIKFGRPDLASIYSQIENNVSLNLSNCYIKDFSLSEYRKNKNLKEDAFVSVIEIKADNCFFESEYTTDFSYAIFSGKKASFRDSIFHLGKVNFEFCKCETELDFEHSFFHVEELNFRFSEFDHGDVNFSNSTIDTIDLIFVNANFGEGNVSFKQTDFKKSNCNFQYARFTDGNVSFDRSEFRGNDIDFRKIEFGLGKVDFRRVHFGDGTINFSESDFKNGRINFRSSEFGNGDKLFERVSFGEGTVSFDGAIFGNGLLSFKDSSFRNLSLVSSRLGSHCDFRINTGKSLDLSYCVVKDIIDFVPEDRDVKLNTLKIMGVKNLGKMFISWEKNKAFELIASQVNSNSDSKAKQYYLLKESFHANGEYDAEDSAYVAFKRNDLKAKFEEGRKKGKLWGIKAMFDYYAQWLIFDKIGLFATSPIRVFTSMIVVLSLFSMVYVILPFVSDAEIVSSVGDPDHLNLLEKSFYHSAITFFTIGYGDFYPSGHIRWLSAVEGWAGVFLMSYFTVAFVRKILR